jgi:hypothetical protein
VVKAAKTGALALHELFAHKPCFWREAVKPPAPVTNAVADLARAAAGPASTATIRNFDVARRRRPPTEGNRMTSSLTKLEGNCALKLLVKAFFKDVIFLVSASKVNETLVWAGAAVTTVVVVVWLAHARQSTPPVL